MSKLIKLLEKNNYELTKEDIKKYKSNIGLKNNKNNYYTNPLMCYLQFNKNPSIDIIELLKDEKDICDNENKNPLMYYCSNKNIENSSIEIIEYFENQIELKNKEGKIALEYYLHNNKNPSIEIIEILFKNNYINYKYNYSLPIWAYCCNENMENINIKLIEYFYNKFGLKNIDNEWALMNYLNYNKNPSIEIIELLEKEKDKFILKSIIPLLCYYENNNIKNLNPEIIEHFYKEFGYIDFKNPMYVYNYGNIELNIDLDVY